MSMGQKRCWERQDPCAHTDVKMMLLRCGEMLAGHTQIKISDGRLCIGGRLDHPGMDHLSVAQLCVFRCRLRA